MKRAFTLIELLVVVAIIGLISSIVLVSLAQARMKANDSKRVSDLREIQKALELYANDHGGAYPDTSGSFRSECSTWGTYPQQNVVPGLVPTYISKFPSDPDMNVSANTCCYIYRGGNSGGSMDYGVIDFTCPTSSYLTNSTYSSLRDPFYNMWSVYTQGAVTNGWM